MALTTATFALFLHILMVIIGLSAAAVLHVALLQLRAADDVAAARSWPRVIAVLEILLPVAALAILLTGAWTLQASGGEFGWSQGWVITALVGLVAVETAGGLVARAARRCAASSPRPRTDRSTTSCDDGSSTPCCGASCTVAPQCSWRWCS